MVGGAVGRYCFRLYLSDQYHSVMSDHNFEGLFPEEAEQNEIAGPVLVGVGVLTLIVLLIWALG